MTVAGIVAEYNPFHAGHQYHIEATRRSVRKETAVVCVMSGGFVQRGEWAIFSKFARAEAAVRCGADLVLELPVAKALSSAESFARGGVEILKAVGAQYISFGSECGRAKTAERAALALMEPETDVLIGRELQTGVSYATARQRALEQVAGKKVAKVVTTPNDILAVEYIKAVYELRCEMKPIAVLRQGSKHDAEGTSSMPSGAELRRRLGEKKSIAFGVPPAAEAIYRREQKHGRGAVDAERMETAVLSRLRMLPSSRFAALPDASEGLENRLFKAVRTAPTLDAILAAASTKRYATSRLRRMLMCAAIGITAADVAADVPYIRVLAANLRGRELLRDIESRCELPVIVKPATVKTMDADCRRCFALECAADDLLALGSPAAPERKPGADWLTSPIML